MTGGKSLPLLWSDGEFLSPGSPVYAATERGAALGDAVFDTVLCLGGKAVLRQAHQRRLEHSADFFAHRADGRLIAAAYDLSAETGEAAVLRVSISRGAGARGLATDLSQYSRVTAMLSPLPPSLQFQPVALDIAAAARNETSALSQWKTASSYLDAVLATGAARQKGLDDALFLNTRGFAACTTMANIFAVMGRRLITPPVHDGVLPGVTRGLLLCLAADAGLAAEEASLTARDLQTADEVFACNSLRLIMPATNMGGASLRFRSVLARLLRDRIAQETGSMPAPPDWAAD
ncbi:aminotransferase class IV [Leisingera thetidis]|uniref:aminotransferase class IV n=1 Tax=Leisingera thetidis TaxID=2930199 RepID=UPI0021F7FC7C|nr:aminotransferase class IV [Leisingera thetidis]